jgi:hypothetical protein
MFSETADTGYRKWLDAERQRYLDSLVKAVGGRMTATFGEARAALGEAA